MENKTNFRLAKTTKSQYECLLQFLQDNKVLLRGKSVPSDQQTISNLWKKFAADVNSKLLGPPKTPEQWKKVFEVWKGNTKRKRRNNQYLSDLEEALLMLISRIYLGDHQIKDSFRPDADQELLVSSEVIETENDSVILEACESVPSSHTTSSPIMVKNDVSSSTKGEERVKFDHSYTGQKEVENCKTRNLLKEACEAHKEGTLHLLRNNDKLTNSVNKLVHQFEIFNKLKYYEIFKTFDGFENL